MLKFEKDDLVFHPFYGTGTITGTKRLELSGAERLYYMVELAIGQLLMMPVEEAEEAHLHLPMKIEEIVAILFATPQTLTDDFRPRRKHLEGKINSGRPEWVCEALRDLVWRENSAQLSSGDRRLMAAAKKIVSNVLVRQPGRDMREATHLLESMLRHTALAWELSG